jgi:hypothetical protein
MSDLDELRRKLIEAENNQKLKRKALEASIEFREAREADQSVSDLLHKIWQENQRIRQERIDQNNKPIIAAGYEVRTGHGTSSGIGDNGDNWIFVIVHKTSPRINRILIFQGEVSCLVGKPIEVKVSEDFILGHGETEQQAWEDAIDCWNDIEDKINNLPLFSKAKKVVYSQVILPNEQ